MKRTVSVFVALCFMLATTFVPASACFTHPGEPDAIVTPLSPTTAQINLLGFKTRFIAATDECAVALKILPSIQSVDNAQAIISGALGTLNFQVSTGCSAEFTTLFGSNATAFSANSFGQVDSLLDAAIIFDVTLVPGSTLADLIQDLDTGITLIMGEPLLGGSPVAGIKGGGGAPPPPTAGMDGAAVCVFGAPAQLFATNVVSGPPVVPTLTEWGVIVAVILLLTTGVWIIRRRSRGSLAA